MPARLLFTDQVGNSPTQLPSGVASPTNSARDQPFLRARSLNRPSRWERARNRGSRRQKKDATAWANRSLKLFSHVVGAGLYKQGAARPPPIVWFLHTHMITGVVVSCPRVTQTEISKCAWSTNHATPQPFQENRTRTKTTGNPKITLTLPFKDFSHPFGDTFFIARKKL
jgi:hypothetical protein